MTRQLPTYIRFFSQFSFFIEIFNKRIDLELLIRAHHEFWLRNGIGKTCLFKKEERIFEIVHSPFNG